MTMTDVQTLDLVLRTFRVFDGFGGLGPSSLWWRTDGEYAPLRLSVRCDDVFVWGCSDCEELTPSNIVELERARADLEAIDGKHAIHTDTLFCARVRQMRPQNAMYECFDPVIWPLLDACGPERPVGLGNPESRPVIAEAEK